MKKLLLNFFALLLCSQIYAQQPEYGWAFSQGDSASDRALAIKVDSQGDLLIMGLFSGTVDFDPGPAEFPLSSPPSESSIFIQKLDAESNLIWAKKVDAGFYGDTLSGDWLGLDSLGNVYVTGRFTDSVDFDPGSGSFMLNSPNTVSIFVLKLDTNGDFLWATGTGGTGHPRDTRIHVEPNGNLYCTGNFFGNLDVDPGPAIVNLTNPMIGDEQFFIQKLDPSGNFLWAKKIGGLYPRTQHLVSSSIDKQGNIILVGNFLGSIDVDPGPDTTLIESIHYEDFFIVKFDEGGDFVWGKSLSTSENAGNAYVAADSLGSVFLFGESRGQIDVDPGPGSLVISSPTYRARDAFVLKLDNEGAFKWVKEINSIGFGPFYVRPQIIKLDVFGNIYLGGDYNGRVDFDPGPLEYNPQPETGGNSYVLKLNKEGDFQWMERIKPSHLEYYLDQYTPIDIGIDQDQNVYLAGAFNREIDIYPGLFQGFLRPVNQNLDMFVTKWELDTCSNLKAVIDQSVDINCQGVGFVSGSAVGGIGPYTYEWNVGQVYTDSFAVPTNPGIHTFTVKDARGCEKSSQVLISGPLNTGGSNLVVRMNSTGFPGGLNRFIWLDAFNDGCVVDSGELVLVLDRYLSYVDASILPDTIMQDTLIWRLDNMHYDSAHFQVRIDVKVDSNSLWNAKTCNYTEIRPLNDGSDEAISFQRYCVDATENTLFQLRSLPNNLCEEGYVSPEEPITYIVRFYNYQGSSITNNLLILDQIDPNLDINSVRVVGKSHTPVITELLPERILAFRFDDIDLPGPWRGLAESSGYLIFEISPLSNLPDGTQILNRVEILQDLQPSKFSLTNTVKDVISSSPVSTDTTFLMENSCEPFVYEGRTHTQSGLFIYFIPRDNECDSIVQLDLRMFSSDTTVRQVGGTLVSQEDGRADIGTIYQWVDCANANAPIPGANERTFSPTQNGTYAVILNKLNCVSMSACHFVGNVGIDPSFQSSLRVFPNPTSNKTEVDLSTFYSSVEVEILNAIGQQKEVSSFQSVEKVSLDLPEETGMYFLKITADNKQAVLKVLKK